MNNVFLDSVRFNDDGLVAVIVVDEENGNVLMQAWMNREALSETVQSGEMVYWSRSRQRRWRKGESSGHTQTLKSLWLDCDGDALLARVKQNGGIACHTGRESCFYQQLSPTGEWEDHLPVLKTPQEIYGEIYGK